MERTAYLPAFAAPASVRSKNMAAIKDRNTRPEMLVRKKLHAAGFRYTLNNKKLPGKPDVVLPRFRVVLFIHGCFWHGHEPCTISHIPRTNTTYWAAKIQRNKARDASVADLLRSMGWTVLIVWECSLENDVIRLLLLLNALRSNPSASLMAAGA